MDPHIDIWGPHNFHQFWCLCFHFRPASDLQTSLQIGNAEEFIICKSYYFGLMMKKDGLVCFGLLWFYGISTTVGYLMLNAFLYI